MDAPTADELQGARRPLASLLSKSEKAQQKVAPGTWQDTMLRDNVTALRIALTLVNGEDLAPERVTPTDLQDALRALASMAEKAGTAQSKFPPGTSHYALQRNRLGSLRVAEALIREELDGRTAVPRSEPDRRNM